LKKLFLFLKNTKIGPKTTPPKTAICQQNIQHRQPTSEVTDVGEKIEQQFPVAQGCG
jgi:hypothetical protein